LRREFPKESLSECPVLAPKITGIYLQGDSGSNSLFGGHDTMVGGRLAEEFAQLPHQKTLSMITDEGKTSQKCQHCLGDLFVMPKEKF